MSRFFATEHINRCYDPEFKAGEPVVFITALNRVKEGVVVDQFVDHHGDVRVRIDRGNGGGPVSPTADRVGRRDA